ncbi:MAG: hypothetical protein IPF71_18020 [Rhodoferax sp.]|nr:hypothetical protein [Rhodoferax sp.]
MASHLERKFEKMGARLFSEVDSCVMTVSSGTVDLVVKDKDGNAVSDTKRERLDKQKRFANLADKHRKSDATLDQMLKSYQKSVKDPENELVHLYEIRDSLSERFGSKSSAIKKLSITSNEWDEIGKTGQTSHSNRADTEEKR